MRILLLGANGQVGRECRRALAPLGEVIAATRDGALEGGGVAERADFSRPADVAALVERLDPDAVVNAAAYTAVDRAESESDIAFRTNAETPAAVARACEELGIPLLHYSTDYVFSGEGATPWPVDAPTQPLGVYGESKLAGEEAIRASGCRHAILRTAWVYASHGRNFLLTMLRLAGERDELRVVADQTGTPTPAGLIADVTAQVLSRGIDRSGIWHLVPHGQTSWHGFAEAILQGAHARGLIERVPRIVPITTAEFPTPARRPAWSVLDNGTLVEDFGLQLPDWQAELDGVLDALAASRAAEAGLSPS